MNKKLIVGLAILAAIAYTFLGQNNDASPEEKEAFNTEILKYRDDQVKGLQATDYEPFYNDSTFQGLSYFSPNLQYKVNARLDWNDNAERIAVPTSSGKKKYFKKAVTAHFSLNGNDHELILLKPEANAMLNYYFLAFTDLTSGEETYGGGRYINIEGLKKGQLQTTIDFNKAYNPYCAYKDGYNCPIPLRENRLATKVEAGEKNYQASH
ncbi:DUF1684 domain-containing protein [Sediminitomix flava]|uniref:DUF1684 domain-containing protein n=1 Tax=Sediminitomix flava TaxID=379075 RepID=A0A315ZFT1_SEDFL|nr:DUF1684 domain-containing protein [Sediminitomix flava]PWJ43708.1 hypothetical protein BC781_10154 [Sediminitomix flava]